MQFGGLSAEISRNVNNHKSGRRGNLSGPFLFKPAAEDAVEPGPTALEPTAGADGLAAEAKDELTVAVALEGEAYVHELEVFIATLFGVGHRSPYGHHNGAL